MKNPNAQASLEYLMTYGWALAVLLIAVVAIAFLVNPAQLMPTYCSGFDTFVIKNHYVRENGLELVVINRSAVNVKNPRFGLMGTSLVGTTRQAPDINADVYFASGSTEHVMLDLNGSIGQNYSLDLNLLYFTDENFSRYERATCHGRIEGKAASSAPQLPPPACDNDGVCESGENSSNCLSDCPIAPLPICGNGVINVGEDCSTCPADVKCPKYFVCDEGQCVPAAQEG